MSDLDVLWELCDRLTPPSFDELVTVSRRRRRGAVLVGLAAAASVLAVGGVIGTALTGGDRAVGPARTPTPSVPSPSPTVELLSAGRHVVTKPAGVISDYLRLVVEVPEGWVSIGGRLAKDPGRPGEVSLTTWSVATVYDDPCRWATSSTSRLELDDKKLHGAYDPAAVGTEFAPLAQGGLARQRDREASTPRKVRLDGASALVTELSVPTTLDLSTCDGGEFRSWKGRGPDPDVRTTVANAHHVPGQVDVVYQVDLDRAPLVLVASHGPHASAADLAELQEVIDTMVVDRGP